MSPRAGMILVNEIAPRLRASTRKLKKVGADDHGELYADGIAIAAGMLDSAERRGKQVPPASVAEYSTRHLAVGRRSTFGGRRDAMCPAAQLDGNLRLHSMEAEHGCDTETGETACVGDFVAGGGDDPAQAAARNLDWEDFMSGLDGLGRQMVCALAEGRTMRSLKSLAGVCDSTMSTIKRQLATAVIEHFGADCLADVSRPPEWAIDVAAQREKEACRFTV